MPLNFKKAWPLTLAAIVTLLWTLGSIFVTFMGFLSSAGIFIFVAIRLLVKLGYLSEKFKM